MLIYGCGVIFYENFEFDLESLKRRRAGIASVFQHMYLGHDLVVLLSLIEHWLCSGSWSIGVESRYLR